MPVIVKKKVQLEDDTEEEPREPVLRHEESLVRSRSSRADRPRAGARRADRRASQWSKDRALAALGIREVPFEMLDGNTQGYAVPSERTVAINPITREPWATLFHEIAHCLLHADRGKNVIADGENLPLDLAEGEAEAVAYLCCATLGLGGLEKSRAYVQHWLASPERRELFRKSKCPQRVFAAADKILKAGSASSTQNADREAEATA